MYYLISIGLSLLAIAVLCFGWRYAEKFRLPRRFRTGLGLIAFGLVGLWAFPFCVHLATKNLPIHLFPTELKGIVFLLVILFAFGFIGGGAETILKANNSPNADSWENILGP